MLNPFRPPSPPRRITEVWGIPSPIDTVFTRCNCEGKTFFFKVTQKLFRIKNSAVALVITKSYLQLGNHIYFLKNDNLILFMTCLFKFNQFIVFALYLNLRMKSRNMPTKPLTSFSPVNNQDSQYWRFTNDVADAGYPKQIVKGFGGLTGKVVAALSIAKYKDRPESVYFFKRGMYYTIVSVTLLL